MATKRLKPYPIRQTPGFCGPASLASLFRYYGIRKSEAVVAKVCRASRRDGTSFKKMKRCVRTFGFEPVISKNTSWNKLMRTVSSGTPVIVNWYSDYIPPEEGHYSVAFRVTPKTISLMDPELGGVRRLPKRVFLEKWYDYDDPGKRLVKRWMMSIEGLRNTK